MRHIKPVVPLCDIIGTFLVLLDPSLGRSTWRGVNDRISPSPEDSGISEDDIL